MFTLERPHTPTEPQLIAPPFADFVAFLHTHAGQWAVYAEYDNRYAAKSRRSRAEAKYPRTAGYEFTARHVGDTYRVYGIFRPTQLATHAGD